MLAVALIRDAVEQVEDLVGWEGVGFVVTAVTMLSSMARNELRWYSQRTKSSIISGLSSDSQRIFLSYEPLELDVLLEEEEEKELSL